MNINDLGLKLFDVYRQCDPTLIKKGEWAANLWHAGQVWARDSTHALREAQAQRLAVAPLVEEVEND